MKWLKSKSDFQPDKKLNEESDQKKKRKWMKKSKYQRMIRKQKKQMISVIFNYSSVTLIKDMENLLNRGLNFSDN